MLVVAVFQVFCYCIGVNSFRLSLAFVSQSFILAAISPPFVLFGPKKYDERGERVQDVGSHSRVRVVKFAVELHGLPHCNSCQEY